jgi:hypothetical protein
MRVARSSERISSKAAPAFKKEDTHPAQQVNEIMLTFKGYSLRVV